MLKFAEFPAQWPRATPRRWFPTLCGGFAFSSVFFFAFRCWCLRFPLGPPKRVAFATHTAVSRFPHFSVPVLGGVPISLGPSLKIKKKMDPPPAAAWFFCLCSTHGRLVLGWSPSRRWLPTRWFRVFAVFYIPVMAAPLSPLAPPKRLVFAAHAVVSRFPILAFRCWGPRISRARFLKKKGPAVASFFFLCPTHGRLVLCWWYR